MAKRGYTLIHQIEDESLTPLPAANRAGDPPVIGRTSEFKFGTDYYDGVILAMSGELQQLYIGSSLF